jgi:hypothetical protein
MDSHSEQWAALERELDEATEELSQLDEADLIGIEAAQKRIAHIERRMAELVA